MKKSLIFAAVAVASTVSLCPVEAAQVSTVTGLMVEQGFTPVGLKRARNHVFAQCRLNGQDFSLVVDTGAGSTVLDAAKATRLVGAVKKVEGRAIGMAGEMAGGRRSGEIKDMEVGSFKAGSQEVELWDFSRHRPPAIGMSMDGLLGIDFLHRHQAVIDCFQMNLFLKSPTAPSTSAALGAGLRAGGCTEIPLQAVGRSLTVSTRINGTPGFLVVDTGSPWTILREGAIANLNLRHASAGLGFQGGMAYQKGLGDASGRSGTGLKMVYFNTMEIGGFSVPPQAVGAAELASHRGGPGGVFFGYLGQDLLAYYVGIIDCNALKLYLRLDPVIEAARKKRS